MARPWIYLFAALFCLHSTQGQDVDAPPARWNVASECQFVVVPQATALGLLPELHDDATVDAAFTKLQALIAKGEAELAGHLVARSESATLGRAQTGEELRYATEFDPPQLPVGVVEKPELLKDWPIVGVTPTSFETRNLGVSLTIDVTVKENGQLLSLNVEALHTRFLRWTKTDAGRLANGEHLFVEQPVFHVASSKSAMTIRSGQRILLGVHKTPAPTPQMELFFLKVTATPAPTSK